VDRLLTLMNKQTTREMNEAAAAKLAKLGIPMMSSFIFGLPTETREELVENVRFMIKVRSLLAENRVSYMFYMPTPATPLFALAIEHGYVPPADLEEWSRFTFRLKSINVPWLSDSCFALFTGYGWPSSSGAAVLGLFCLNGQSVRLRHKTPPPLAAARRLLTLASAKKAKHESDGKATAHGNLLRSR